MTGIYGDKEKHLASIRDLITAMKDGAGSEKMTDQLIEELRFISPSELDNLSGEMKREGIPEDSIRSLYELYPESMKKYFDRKDVAGALDDPIHLRAGILTKRELEGMLDALPVELTFIDRDDISRYFNNPPARMFGRDGEIIGHHYHYCHSEKALPLSAWIIDELKSGHRDDVKFWIKYKGKKMHIMYFAVRDENGEYLGCLEFIQDISGFRKIRRGDTLSRLAVS